MGRSGGTSKALVNRKGGNITRVPNGPLIKKKGEFKGSTLKRGGKMKRNGKNKKG